VGKIDLIDFLKGIKAKPYKNLIEYHIRRHDTSALLQGCVATISLLPIEYQASMEDFIDHMNVYSSNKAFWNYSCYDVFNIIVLDAYSYYRIGKKSVYSLDDDIPQEDHEFLFNLFQTITLSFAYSASLNTEFRKFIDIKKGFFKR